MIDWMLFDSKETLATRYYIDSVRQIKNVSIARDSNVGPYSIIHSYTNVSK